MKVICPEHHGIVRLPDTYINKSNIVINNLVVDCPVCEDEVLIQGVFDFDETGFGRQLDDCPVVV